jgi:hypothetical protein
MDVYSRAAARPVTRWRALAVAFLIFEGLTIATHWRESTAFAGWFYGWLWTNVAPVLDRLTGLR